MIHRVKVLSEIETRQWYKDIKIPKSDKIPYVDGKMDTQRKKKHKKSKKKFWRQNAENINPMVIISCNRDHNRATEVEIYREEM